MKIELPTIKPKIIIAGLVGFFIISSSLTLLSKFPVFMDEALYSNMADRLAQGQGLNTPLFKDFIPALEKYAFWYPPFYFLLLAATYSIFEAGITVGRLFSLVCGLGVLASLIPLTKKIFNSHFSILTVFLILVLDHYFQDGSIVLRMEMLTLLLGLIALLLHSKFIEKRDWRLNLFSGIFSALSLLTHPTAAIILLPIGINLLFLSNERLFKKLSTLFTYGVPILIGLSLWAVNFFPHLDIFILQYQVQLHRKAYAVPFILEIFKYKLFPSVVMLIYFVSDFIFVARNASWKKLSDPKLRLWVMLAITSSLLPFYLKEMWYLLYISVFGAVILLRNIEWGWAKSQFIAISVLLILIMSNTFVYLDNLSEIASTKDTYWSFSQKISEYLPQNASVILGSYPDPFFYFDKHRPDLTMQIVPNSPHSEPIDPEIYNLIFGRADYVALSYFLNRHVYNYINQNVDQIVYDNSLTGGYKVQVIKLKPVGERKPLDLGDEEVWEYPKLGE